MIVNNSMLDFVHIEQEEAGLKPVGTDLPNPNYAAVAEAMGAKGVRVEDPHKLRGALQEAFAHEGGPVVVDVLVDKYALALPAGVPFEAVKGFTLSMFKQALGGDLDAVWKSATHNVKLL